MSYVSLDQTKLVTGSPVTQDIEVQIANDLDYLNTQVTALNNALLNAEPYTFEVVGDYAGLGNGQTGLTFKRVHTNITLIGIQLFLITDGTSGGGSLQIDIQYKRGAGAWASIFTTLPNVAQGNGDLYVTTGGGVIGVTTLNTGDLLRLDVPFAMGGSNGFQALLSYQTR